MNTAPAIVFDLDGTLVDTLRDIGEAMNRTLARNGFPEKALAFYPTAIGDGMKKLLERSLHPQLIDPAQGQDMLARFKQDYAEHLIVHSGLYPGIEDLLQALEAANIPKAVFSNKPDELTRRIVQELMGPWSFTAVQGQLEGVPLKPDADTTRAFLQRCGCSPDSAYMVGDTCTDMKTAVAAGMIPIGVRWGFREAQELLDHGAYTVLDHPMHLLDMISLPGQVH